MVNPGSVGLPRDSGGKANYAVYEQGTVTLKQVAYDVEATIADLDSGYRTLIDHYLPQQSNPSENEDEEEKDDDGTDDHDKHDD